MSPIYRLTDLQHETIREIREERATSGSKCKYFKGNDKRIAERMRKCGLLRRIGVGKNAYRYKTTPLGDKLYDLG